MSTSQENVPSAAILGSRRLVLTCIGVMQAHGSNDVEIFVKAWDCWRGKIVLARVLCIDHD